MGRGYMRWACDNKALFRALYHPDVNRYASTELSDAISQFTDDVRRAVAATQADGRHPDVPLDVLNLFTNSVPAGAAMLLVDPLLQHNLRSDRELDALIAQVINLVVPI